MILHLLRSPEFIGYTIDYFETIQPDNNRYCFISSATLANTRPEHREKLETIRPGSAEYQELLMDCNSYQSYIFHSLHPEYFSLIDHIHPAKRLCWIMYGTEVYDNIETFRVQSYLPKTAKFYRSSKLGLINRFKPYYRRLTGKMDNERRLYSYLRRFRYCAAPHPTLHQLLRQQGITNLEYLEFSYYSIEQTIGDQLIDAVCEGDKILFGNSASFTNNHLDGFGVLKKIPLNNELIVPLTYGNEELRNKIIRTGEKYFGSSFHPIKTHLPRDEYNKLMLSCSYVILNHSRPQARGNLLTALWLGAKVFLQEKNSFYKEFRNKGINVYASTQIEKEGQLAFSPLGPEEIKSNRENLWKHYNRKRVIEYANALVNKTMSSGD